MMRHGLHYILHRWRKSGSLHSRLQDHNDGLCGWNDSFVKKRDEDRKNDAAEFRDGQIA
ncbi:predicted protein [Plenodomus lingam JN3]|uniref:Predicted protein n=1 Tax=Leptosphaeria maculans (strain JN3 / isolate v23.1.3 / race Av1-4-5-6-7-8) TaxID=985895 RepID=E5AEY7_LEPMJ|nr:predicted protein [Plenodomus lingam JN3]CBY01776.1 predicted protein [Plenodomus lingam JN3]